MYTVTGVATKTIYFKGSKADCFRYLNARYPSFEDSNRKNAAPKDPVFPENMVVSRIVNH